MLTRWMLRLDLTNLGILRRYEQHFLTVEATCINYALE